ncbi:PAP2 family protein [Pandoraea iniqua]|uniref:PAP2 family protein n=1 Tax=Pandoraea iniqua TaxID=2508288 RepID=A0A5E4XH16_9BURK|nr:PAP2 family protein [Pandoraea iniqua]
MRHFPSDVEHAPASRFRRRDPTPHRSRPSSARQYVFAWAFTVALALLDLGWIDQLQWSLSLTLVARIGMAMACLLLIAAALFRLSHTARFSPYAEKLRCRELARGLAWFAVLQCFFFAADVLQYLSVTVGAPLIDERLMALDRLIGFDWLAHYRWVHSHPMIEFLFILAYASFWVQLLIIPVLLGYHRNAERLPEFVINMMVTAVLCVLISLPIPAASLFLHYDIADIGGTAWYSDFRLLREGAFPGFAAIPRQGLIALPSFHAATAVLITYSLRRTPRFRYWAGLNLLMLIATPSRGGHYLVDVVAGVLLAIAVIAIGRLTR